MNKGLMKAAQIFNSISISCNRFVLRRFFRRLLPREAYGVRGDFSAVYTHLSVELERGAQRHNPVGVDDALRMRTQGSSFLATLGWRTQSRWDWNARNDVLKELFNRRETWWRSSRSLLSSSAGAAGFAIAEAHTPRRPPKHAAPTELGGQHGTRHYKHGAPNGAFPAANPIPRQSCKI